MDNSLALATSSPLIPSPPSDLPFSPPVSSTSPSESPFIAPANEVVTPVSGGFVAPAKDTREVERFAAPSTDVEAQQTLDRIDSQTSKQLADDHEFNPASVVAQYHTALTPARIDKLAEAYHSQRQQHMTASDVGRAVKKTPSALKDFVVGAFQLAKRVPSVIGQAGRSAALTPEALAATNAQNLIDRGNLSDEDRARYQGVIDNYNKLKAGLDQSNQSPEVKNQSKDTAEVLAGLESGTTGLAHLVFKDKTDNQKEFNPDTARTRLLNDAAYLEQQKLTGEGKGEFAKSLAMDADTFAKDGVQLDPKVIEQMSSVESPITWIPILAGAKIAALGNGAFQVLNKAGIPIATAATRQAAEKVIAWSGEKIAQAGEKISGSGTGLAKLAGVGHLIHGGGLTGLATAAVVKAGATVAGKAVETVGKVVANPAVYKPLLDFAGGAAKGSVGGAAFGVPLAALADSPQEAADALVTSAGFGAAGGAAHVGVSKLKSGATGAVNQASLNAVQHVVAAHFSTVSSLQPVNNFSLPNAHPVLEAQHQANLTALGASNPLQANLINRTRAAMAVKGVPSYVLTPEQSESIHPDLKGKDGANDVPVPTASGVKEGVVWILNDSGGVAALGHETGHFIDNSIATKDEKDALNKITEGDFQKGFDEHYKSSTGLTDEQRASLTPKKLQAELRAEIFGAVIDGANLSKLPQNLQQSAVKIAAHMAERLGLYQPGISDAKASNVTGFGTKLSPTAHSLAREVINRWMQDPEVQSALNNISKEPAPPAPANPNAPAPSVTPAHETVLELLKPKVSTDEFKSWTGIKEKIQKGEPLTPSEAQDWGKLDEVAQTIPPEIEAATASPAPTTGEIKPADTTKPVAPIEPGKSAPVPSSEEIKPVENKAPQPSVSKDIPNLRVTREQQNKFENTPERTDIGIQEAEAALKDASPEQKSVFQTIREALRAPQGQVKPVEIVHSSVEPVEETPGGTRTKRRSEQEEQGTRKEYQKLIIPDGFNVTAKGKVQLRAVSPDKVLANAKQIAANKKAAPFIPYEVKNGNFTEASAKEFNNDLEQYWVNQAAGFKGDGSPLVRPEGHGGFIPSENNQGQVKPIDKAKVDFLNLVQGIAPPKTARVNVEPITQAPIKPVNVRAFELAKANSKEPMKPGVIRDKDINKQTYENYGNQQISEFNPLRKKLDEAGVSTRELLEATERLNLEDIKKAVSRPDNRLRAPVTDVTAAGFLPSRMTNEQAALAAAEEGYSAIGHNTKGSRVWIYDAANRSIKDADGLSKTHDEAFGKKAETTFKGRFDPKSRSVSVAFPLKELNKLDHEPTADDIPSGVYRAVQNKYGKDVDVQAFLPSRERSGGTEGKKLDPEWQVSVQKDARFPQFGYVQIDDVTGGRNLWSKSPKTLREEGYNVPDSLFDNVTTGRYKLGDLLKGEAKDQHRFVSNDIKGGLFDKEKPALQNVSDNAQFLPATEEQTDKAKTGLAFKDFFSRVTRGQFGKSEVPFQPVLNLQGAEPFLEELANHSGNFDDHISKSIPTFKETQVKKGNAIVKTFGDKGARMLDIAASEGSLAKTITSMSNGKIKTVSLDPNPDMAKFFKDKSDVAGATYEEKAFREGFEDNGVKVPAYKPKEKFDVVHESMGFQFISPDRAGQVAEAARLMKPSGVLLMEEKVRNPEWAANETKKDTDWKDKYFSKEELKAKDKVVGFQQSKQEAKSVGMVDNMVQASGLEDLLTSKFKHVVQYWDSGNFKGYAASNDPAVLWKLVHNMGDLHSEYSTVETPRQVEPGIQFQPNRDPRAVKQAAIKADDGSIFEGPMHLFAHEAAARANHEGPFTDGFVTNNGEFLDRNEAFKRAEELGQYHSLMGETELESNSFTGQQRRREAGFDEGTDPLSLQFQPKGKSKIKDEDILPLTHYTGTSGLKELDPEFHGTGYPGAERKRAQNYSKIYQKRTYFGMPGYEKEPGLGNNRYGAKVPKTSLYDFQGDPDSLYPTTSEIEKAGYAPMDNGAKVTLYEKRIKDAGYKGYFNKEAKAVAMFDKTPVESEGVQFLPSRNRIEDQLELGKPVPPVDRYDRAYINSLTPKEKRQLWPEAIHGKEGPLRSAIVDSPRYKEAPDHAAAVESFANELVKKYNEHGRTPEAESGQEWYSEIAPRLNKFFGEDAPIFAELLAATSPQTNPAQNFRMALEAYKLYKAGWYDENIAKFEEGMRKSQDGTLLRDYKRNTPESKRPDTIGTGTLMQYWIEKHDLKPTKAPKLDKGELKQPLYSMSSEAVLKVLARRWLEQNGGPKTANFVKNLLGTGTGATIDLWADRTMREAGYKGYVKNWRILPENGAGVTDKDFHFSQEAFASAADKLGIKPNELQGAMWFIEKKLWAENGWSPLDLGDYRPHLAELADSGKTVKDIMADVPVTRERAVKNAEIQAKQIKAETKEREKAQRVLNAEIQALKKKQIAFDF